MSQLEMIQKFKSLGATNNVHCDLAGKIYFDLKEEVGMRDLQYHYDKSLDIIYFYGQRTDDDPEVIIPISKNDQADMLKFEEIHRRLAGDCKCVTMAVCNNDATILYYSVKDEFEDP